jgi:hypothetical protein
MSRDSAPPEPPRLTGQTGETSELLRSADAGFRDPLDESSAFRRVERGRKRRTAMNWGLACAGAGLAAFLVSQSAGRFGTTEHPISVTAEPLPAPAPREPVAPKVEEQKPARLAETPPPSPLPGRMASAEPVDEARCRRLAAAGDGERAFECFQTLARGSGIGAEVASYEAARVSAELLRDAPRALRLLDEHRVRYPDGAMRGEVRWLRVRTLERAGKLDEALSESEALLAVPEGRALASDVHWLRARIYEVRHDCAHAATELVSLVGEPGARGDEAEMKRAACLEELGRTSEALAAYQHYLERAGAARAEQARARVEALRP